ncbi:LacI family DNA-binding transcriptional regulator [Neobacillus cucumis]|uniref:Transcriptional regulator n=1 Tax=Neobacillus cucumis TaxID=1740721 RepID=A0A2N5HVW9_9BACI|nr:LacI family DNA-binding transcriptional regulator [Neobacillus cucumis]PLS09663.1 transcriptional regulator [Neobacillus cucumis]
MATIRDVAKLASVSVATVSRVINKNGYVNKQTEIKVLESMKLLNYKPHTIARALSNKQTYTLALILPDITNPFFPELARAIEDTATKFGYSLILANSDSNKEKTTSYIESLTNRYVDGIIFASHELSLDKINQIKDSGIPMATLDRAVNLKGLPSIGVQNYEGGIMAVKHLLSMGCSKIGHICGPIYYHTSIERYKGYVDALEDINQFHPSYVVQGDFSIESGFEMANRLLSNHPEIDGIFAANDLMAVGALKALIRLKKKIPEEVALIGFDGISITSQMEPEISTIAQPIYQIGAMAVNCLIDQIQKKIPCEQSGQELELKLVARASTLKSKGHSSI